MKNKFVACRVVLVVFLAFFAFSTVSFAININSCTAISSAGSYVLTADLQGVNISNSCIMINASHVELDCAGHSITNNGTGGDTKGVYALADLTNITVKNCRIYSYYRGIEAFQVNSSSFINNTAHNIPWIAFESANNHHNVFANNTADNATWGFYILSCSNHTLESNTVLNSTSGFSVSDYGQGGHTFRYNNATNIAGSAFVFDESNNNNIIHNSVDTVTGTFGSYGFFLLDSLNNNLTNNSVTSGGSRGYQLWNSNSTIFTDNTASGCTAGFSAETYSSADNTFINNTACDNSGAAFNFNTITNYTVIDNTACNSAGGNGFHLYQISYSRFENNTAYNDDYGFYVSSGGGYNSFINNTVHDSDWYGFYILGSANSNFTNNTAYNQQTYYQYGMYISSCDNSRIEDNKVYDNHYGLDIYGGSGYYVANNLICNNGYRNFELGSVSDSDFYNTTVCNCSMGGGIYLVSSVSRNNFYGTVSYGNRYGIYAESGTSQNNSFYDTLIYDPRYDYDAYPYYIEYPDVGSGSWLNFTNLTVGYNANVGLINFVPISVQQIELINGTDILLDPYFVSLSATHSPETNVSANITILTENCSWDIYKQDGFPKMRAQIQGGYNYTPVSYDTCSAGVRTFDVAGFSGFTTFTMPPTNCDMNITSPGTYTLTQDYYGAKADRACVTIDSDDVVLDCADHVLAGNSPITSIAIWVEASDNVTIRNCNITNYTIGVSTINTAPEVNPYSSGPSSNLTMEYNRIYDMQDGAGSAAVYLEQMDGATIEDNLMRNTGAGIVAINSAGLDIEWNGFNEIGGVASIHSDSAIAMEGSVSDVYIDSNGYSDCQSADYCYGLNLAGRYTGFAYAYDFVMIDESLYNYSLYAENVNNSVFGYISLNGAEYFEIDGAYNSYIGDITAQNINYVGFYSADDDNYNTTYSDLTIQGCEWWCADFYYVHDCTIENINMKNAISGAYGGDFEYVYDSVIRNVVVNGTEDAGVYFGGSDRNNITDMTVTNSSGYGLDISSSDNNSFTNIKIYGMTDYLAVSSSPNSFTNLAIGNSSTVGLVNWSFVTLTDVDLVEGVNIILDNYFVSMDAADLGTAGLNKSAKISILTENCSWNVVKKAGFPTTRAEIQANGTYFAGIPTNCAGGIRTFTADAFSGYTTYNITAPFIPSAGGGGEAQLSISESHNCSPGSVLFTVESRGEPVEEATVRISKQDTGAVEIAVYTDNNGQAEVQIPDAGTYEAKARASGYIADEILFTIPACPPAPIANVTPPEEQRCLSDSECGSTQICENGVCTEVTGDCGYAADHRWNAYACCNDSDCGSGQRCTSHVCVAVPGVPAENITADEAESMITDAADAIAKAEEEGKDVSAAEAKLREAQAAFDGGDYERARLLAEDARQLALSSQPKEEPSEEELPPGGEGGFPWGLLLGVLIVLAIIAGLVWAYTKKK